MDVANKLTVISGGSQGLGLSLAKEAVKGGGSVVVVARTESKLKEAVSQLEKLKIDESQSVSYVSADVTSPAECRKVFEHINKVPDNVICCAGAAVPGLFIEFEGEELDKHMSLSYHTALHFSHAALRVMVKSDTTKRRHLVYCASVLSMFSFIGYSSYGPAKSAIRALADIVRQECIPYNIGVHCIFPGNMATEGFEIEERTKPEITKKIEGSSDAKDPDEVAKDVLKDLRNNREMIYTDFIGWLLSCMMLGASPRNWGFFQAIVAFVLAIFGPLWYMLIKRDIRQFYDKQK